jgi:hypothetical protein
MKTKIYSKCIGRTLSVILFCAVLSACSTRKPDARRQLEGDNAARAYLSPDRLNVALRTESSGSPHADAIAGELPSRLQSTLVGEGFRIDESRPMLLVTVRVDAEEEDRTGNYYTLNARALAQVVSEYEPQRPVLASRTFTVEGRRTRGQAAAQRDAAEKLASEHLRPFVGEALRRGAERLVVQTIEISFPRFFGPDQRSYPDLFVREVAAIDGVLDCLLVEQDLPGRRAVFRIVHSREAFPQGLETALHLNDALRLRF